MGTLQVEVNEVGVDVCVGGGTQLTAPRGPVILQLIVPAGAGVVATETVATKVKVCVPDRGSVVSCPTTVIVGVGFGGGENFGFRRTN